MYKMGEYNAALFYIERAIQNQTEETSKEIYEHYKTIKRKHKKQ
jgi:hypothetical protein